MKTKEIGATILLIHFALVLPVSPVWAHGESVRGVGGGTLNTTGAEIAEEMSLSVRYDRRSFELFSDQELLDFRRIRGEDVHQHEREESIFLVYSVGLSADVDLNFQLALNRFTGFEDNGDDFAVANDTLSVTDVSEGLGDFLILGRYRFWRHNDHHLAALAGIKLPSGNVRERTNAGDIVGTHNQPGSGSVDFQLGTAYSGHFLDGRIGVSGDAIGRINTEGAGEFRSGNSLQLDLALSYQPHAWLVPVVEFNSIFQERDIEDGEVKENSGVSSLFITPGLRFTIAQRHSFFALFSWPLWQDLPGIQNDEDYRIAAGYGISFNWEEIR